MVPRSGRQGRRIEVRFAAWRIASTSLRSIVGTDHQAERHTCQLVVAIHNQSIARLAPRRLAVQRRRHAHGFVVEDQLDGGGRQRPARLGLAGECDVGAPPRAPYRNGIECEDIWENICQFDSIFIQNINVANISFVVTKTTYANDTYDKFCWCFTGYVKGTLEVKLRFC